MRVTTILSTVYDFKRKPLADFDCAPLLGPKWDLSQYTYCLYYHDS